MHDMGRAALPGSSSMASANLRAASSDARRVCRLVFFLRHEIETFRKSERMCVIGRLIQSAQTVTHDQSCHEVRTRAFSRFKTADIRYLPLTVDKVHKSLELGTSRDDGEHD
jgi:hypothetical protein